MPLAITTWTGRTAPASPPREGPARWRVLLPAGALLLALPALLHLARLLPAVRLPSMGALAEAGGAAVLLGLALAFALVAPGIVWGAVPAQWEGLRPLCEAGGGGPEARRWLAPPALALVPGAALLLHAAASGAPGALAVGAGLVAAGLLGPAAAAWRKVPGGPRRRAAVAVHLWLALALTCAAGFLPALLVLLAVGDPWPG